jgi:hypothetical protein
MEFKQLELKQEGNWLKRTLAKHTKKTILSIIIGALIGFTYFYFSQGIKTDAMQTGDLLKSVFFGAFLGFFITNSPCARNKC